MKLSGYFIPPIFSHVPSARRICSGLTTHCICFLSASSITTCVITLSCSGIMPFSSDSRMSAGPSRSCAVSNSPCSRSSCFPYRTDAAISFFSMFMSFSCSACITAHFIQPLNILPRPVTKPDLQMLKKTLNPCGIFGVKKGQSGDECAICIREPAMAVCLNNVSRPQTEPYLRLPRVALRPLRSGCPHRASRTCFSFRSLWACRAAAPVSPFGPCGPASPVRPVSPRSPLSPFGPCGPAGPVSPLGPLSPVAPAGPVSPRSPLSPFGP
ncbi:hypothetical protein ECDEC11C_1927 [Escherichia coli DEC11C]|nr:hypothetical protein ECDEC11C_1927 [Escherichia coli DEC11C]